MQTYTINHNGFHGRTTLTVRPIRTEGEGDELRGIVSQRTAHRLDDMVCGISDCRCGERLSQCADPYALDPIYWVYLSLSEHRGRYPQA